MRITAEKIDFTEVGALDDFFASALKEKRRGVYAGNIKKRKPGVSKYISFPANRFRKVGASVSRYSDGFMVDFSRTLVAAGIDENFVKRLLISADEDGLIQITDAPLWTVKRVGPKRFFVTRS